MFQEPKPRLRNLEPVPLNVEGAQVIGLRDPLNINRQIVCVQPWTLPILQLLDGAHTLKDIQAELSKMTGNLIFLDELSELIEQLDDQLLLESEKFREALQRRTASFRNQPFREAFLAGKSYSDNVDELAKELESFFTSKGGPGTVGKINTAIPKGIIAPHIDIRSGGACFAHAYHALASSQPADLYIILGTGHQGVTNLLTATGLDFATPLGRVKTDKDFIAALSRRLVKDVCAEELLHETEHVIEFQTIFLQYVFGGNHNFEIVPLLCSVPHNIFTDPELIQRRQHFYHLCEAISRQAEASGKRVCYIASADFDHIGPRYGDHFIPNRASVNRSLEQDAILLNFLENLDTSSFMKHVSEIDAAHRICGFSPIVTMLHCMQASHGQTLALDFTPVDDKNSFVSYASMIFY